MNNTWEIMSIIDHYNKRINNTVKYSKEYEKLRELYAQAIRIQCRQNYGYVMTIDDFVENVEDGYFIDYDGSGVFLDSEGKRHEYIRCNAKWLKTHQNDYKYVLWFNK